MRISFSTDGWDDYLYWQKKDRTVLGRINNLLRDIARDPDAPGLGKAERLQGDLSGYCSRRITGEHRLVYRTDDSGIVVIQCRFHY